MESVKQTRLELRLTDADKRFFERASRISGHKSLTSFVTSLLKREAKEIISEHERILTTERDKEIFFDAVLFSDKPNKKLKRAAKEYLNNELNEITYRDTSKKS